MLGEGLGLGFRRALDRAADPLARIADADVTLDRRLRQARPDDVAGDGDRDRDRRDRVPPRSLGASRERLASPGSHRVACAVRLEGRHAKPGTIEAYARANPEFAARIEFYRPEIERLIVERSAVYDLVSRMMAAVDFLSEEKPRIAPGSSRPPDLIDALTAAVNVIAKATDIHLRLRSLTGPTSPAVLEKIADIVFDVRGL